MMESPLNRLTTPSLNGTITLPEKYTIDVAKIDGCELTIKCLTEKYFLNRMIVPLTFKINLDTLMLTLLSDGICGDVMTFETNVEIKKNMVRFKTSAEPTNCTIVARDGIRERGIPPVTIIIY